MSRNHFKLSVFYFFSKNSKKNRKNDRYRLKKGETGQGEGKC